MWSLAHVRPVGTPVLHYHEARCWAVMYVDKEFRACPESEILAVNFVGLHEFKKTGGGEICIWLRVCREWPSLAILNPSVQSLNPLSFTQCTAGYSFLLKDHLFKGSKVLCNTCTLTTAAASGLGGLDCLSWRLASGGKSLRDNLNPSSGCCDFSFQDWSLHRYLYIREYELDNVQRVPRSRWVLDTNWRHGSELFLKRE